MVKNEQRNAWCMPGGKIVFYTGILATAKIEARIAAIMGHEVAHALADHVAQRMSANTAKLGLDYLVGKSVENKTEDKQKKILMAYGIGSQVAGVLPFSRKHETEADRIGLELMTIAGYEPKEAAELWRRMQAASEGKTPPEILSTHPSSLRRIRNIEAHVPVVDSLAAIIQKN
ncbi:MAG: M48 family metallopeptidase [Flavobacteriaceae bacterium]